MVRCQRTYRECLLAIAAVMGCFGSAQDHVLEQQIAAITDVEARNRTALAEYTWKQEETIVVNDKFQARQTFQAEMDRDGRIQRISMDLPEEKVPGEHTGSGMREWLEQKKERALQKYAEEIRELTETYAQSNPDLLRQAHARGDISYEPAGDRGHLRMVNYAKSGDSVTLVFDQKSNALQSLEASSYLADSKEPVQIAVKFAGGGDELNRVDEITAIDKKRKLQVLIHNFDYQPRL